MIEKFYQQMSVELVSCENENELMFTLAKAIVIELEFNDCIHINSDLSNKQNPSIIFQHSLMDETLNEFLGDASLTRSHKVNDVKMKHFFLRRSHDRSRSYCYISLFGENILIFRSYRFVWLNKKKKKILSELINLASVLINKMKRLDSLHEDIFHLKQQHYAMNSCAIVAFTDANGKITNVNDKFTEIAGYSRDELIGQDHRLINSGYHSKEFFKNLWNTISGGEIWRGEVQNKRKDGSTYWVDSTIFPIKDKQANITGYIAIRYDVTFRKDIELSLTRALSESAFYKSAIDQSSIVAMTDRVGVIQYANDFFCRISGYSQSELIGKDHRILNSGKMPDGFFKEMWTSIRSGQVWRGEVCNKAKNGHLYWVDTVIIPFMDQEGNPDKFMAIRSDITQKKIAEEQLVAAKEEALKAAQVKADFLATISHEIRTPMNGIIGMTDLLLMSEVDHEIKDKITTIKRCGETLLGIVNDVLDLSKLQARKSEIESIPFNINQSLLDTILIFEAKASEKKIELHFSSEVPTHQWVSGDETKFKQVLSNLVSNAIKFTEKGLVNIILKKDRQLYQVEVVDTGIGIDDHAFERIFNPFTQADASTARKYGGTGLGLTISKGLVEMMKGTIQVRSAPEKGTVFTIKLPFDDVARPLIENTDLQLNKSFAERYPLKILIADDNKVNLDILYHFLIKLGYNPAQAQNGQEVLDQVLIQRFDCLILDCHMPVLDGFETTKKIHQLLKNNSPSIIALTASPLKSNPELFFKSGMDYFILKPLFIDKLCDSLSTLSENKLEKHLTYLDNIVIKRNYPEIQDRNFFWTMLLDHLEPALHDLGATLVDCNMSEYKRKLHSFKGMVSTVCAPFVLHHILEMESVNIDHDYEQAFGHFNFLRRILSHLIQEIQCIQAQSLKYEVS